MHLFAFEKLNVWQDARKLAKGIYLLTDEFPKSELFGISSQLRRASISISSNIAEGSSRVSSKEQAHYYQIAYGSLMETLSQLLLSVDLCYLSEEKLNNDFRLQIEKISNQLNALRKSSLQ